MPYILSKAEAVLFLIFKTLNKCFSLVFGLNTRGILKNQVSSWSMHETWNGDVLETQSVSLGDS